MKAAFPNLRLGTAKVDGESSDLWCVDFTKTGISNVALTGATTININRQDVSQPRYFALKPLCDSLVYRTDVSIKPLTVTGKLGAAVNTNYQGIDVELWADRFLSDFEKILSGPYAAALYENSTLNPYLSTIIGSKETIIPSIASRLDSLLAFTSGDDAAPLDNARKSLVQQLGVSLSRAFDTSVVIQYDSIVASPWQKTPPPALPLPANLYGDGSISSDIPGTVTMIAAKTNLSDANSYVNFLTTVQNPARHKEISGKFNYNISHLEFDIKPVPSSSGYVSSNWLSFLPLLTKAEKPAALAKTDPTSDIHVPVPLRIFPGLPVFKGQMATAKPQQF